MSKRLNGGGAAVDPAAVPPRALRVQSSVRRTLAPGFLRIAAALALAATSATCNILDDDQDLPNVARVEITGSAPEALELVVSDNFDRVSDLNQGARYTVLVQADTSFVRPDFVQEYDIEASNRFYVRLTNHTSEVAQITLSVAFDGEVGYSQRANLSEGGALEFSEVFFGT